MPRYYDYNPEQAYLLPPSVKDVLGSDHLCFFVRAVVERLDLGGFEREYAAAGGMLYAPRMMLALWLYGYAVGITSARRLEQRVREDLALRYLAGGAEPDNWALSAFRRRHAVALNDAFTQVLEFALAAGAGKLGRVAIDSTRVRANANRDRTDTVAGLRQRRARLRRQVRRWQKACDADDSEPAGSRIAIAAEQLARLEPRLRALAKSGQRRHSRTDPQARYLRQRDGFVLGYSAQIAVSDDHLIVGQRVTQEGSDNAALVPMVAEVERRCQAPPQRVLADSGFFSLANVAELEGRGVEAYVPDSNLARALNLGRRVRQRARAAVHRRLRRRLRTAAGRATYARRKALVEAVFGTLKQQRGGGQFRLRGLRNVGAEWTLMTTAYNLTRLHTLRVAV